MNDDYYEDKIQTMLMKHKSISYTLIQMKFKLTADEAIRLYKKFVEKKPAINNFPDLSKGKTLIKKHPCKSISVPYLQKRLCLSFTQTEKILSEWRNIKNESDVYKDEFEEIRKYVKPPRFEVEKASLSELQRYKQNRISNAINFLESQGYKVDKK